MLFPRRQVSTIVQLNIRADMWSFVRWVENIAPMVKPSILSDWNLILLVEQIHSKPRCENSMKLVSYGGLKQMNSDFQSIVLIAVPVQYIQDFSQLATKSLPVRFSFLAIQTRVSAHK